MKWTNVLFVGWMTAGYLALTWLVLGLIQLASASTAMINYTTFVVVLSVSMFIAIVLSAILMHVKIRTFRVASKYFLVGLFMAIILMTGTLIVTMPFAGWGWTGSTVGAGIFLALSLLLCSRRHFIAVTWHRTFAKPASESLTPTSVRALSLPASLMHRR